MSKYIKVDKWFAWYPVRTDRGWAWWRYVKRTVDERPLVYLGLLEEYYYEKI